MDYIDYNVSGTPRILSERLTQIELVKRVFHYLNQEIVGKPMGSDDGHNSSVITPSIIKNSVIREVNLQVRYSHLDDYEVNEVINFIYDNFTISSIYGAKTLRASIEDGRFD